jgi:hypothetical protein
LKVSTNIGFPPHAVADFSATIPIKGQYSFHAETLGSYSQPVSFNSLSFDDHSANKRQIWTSADGVELVYAKDGARSALIADCTNLSFAEVISPLFLIPALMESWQSFPADYGSFYVASDRVAALLIQTPDENTGLDKSGFVPLVISSLNIPRDHFPSDQLTWSKMPWRSATRMTGQFDPKTKQLISLEFSVPILGRSRLILQRHSVE